MQNIILDKINQQVNHILENTPIQDVKQNLLAVVLSIFKRLDLVSRDEFDRQQQLLVTTREKLEQLEQQIQTLIKDK